MSVRRFKKGRVETTSCYYFCCDDCGKEVNTGRNTFPSAVEAVKVLGWKIVSLSSPSREDSLRSVRCNTCVEKKKKADYASQDFTTRLHAGYYDDYPENFREEALIDLGILNHPKADKAFQLAWDAGHSGGYSEVYNYLLDYAELLEK